MRDLATPQKYTSLILILLFLLGTYLIHPYAQAEVLTLAYEKEIGANNLCFQNKKEPLQYAKVLEYQKTRRSAKIHCVFVDTSKNVLLEVIYRSGGWQIVFSTLLNKENAFYWPVYI